MKTPRTAYDYTLDLRPRQQSTSARRTGPGRSGRRRRGPSLGPARERRAVRHERAPHVCAQLLARADGGRVDALHARLGVPVDRRARDGGARAAVKVGHRLGVRHLEQRAGRVLAVEDANHVLDLLGQERLDELPALVQRPRRVEHTRAAEELRVVQVGEGHNRLEADEHAQRDVREANAAGVDDHELADEGAGLLRELVRVVRDILEDEVVDVKVLRVVEELEELVDVERAVVDEGHQVARLGAAVRV
mmetsp:Transcript_29648/g.94865  ORF Transcript_29648/g.94865 Transcript_29648/m.94865 type:complete len:249 (+) Transcript_29648:195-941(+)